MHLTHLLDRHKGLTAPIDTLGFRRFDARLLPFADELALHLGHHAQHGHEDRPRSIRVVWGRSLDLPQHKDAHLNPTGAVAPVLTVKLRAGRNMGAGRLVIRQRSKNSPK